MGSHVSGDEKSIRPESSASRLRLARKLLWGAIHLGVGLLFINGILFGFNSLEVGADLLGSVEDGPAGGRNPVTGFAKVSGGGLAGGFGVVLMVLCGGGLIAVIFSALVPILWLRVLFSLIWIGMLISIVGIPMYIVDQLRSDQVPREDAREIAAEALEQAAEAGDPHKQWELGRRYYYQWYHHRTDDIEAACRQALYWYQEAAYQDEPLAQQGVGLSYQYCVPGDQETINSLVYVWYRVLAERQPQNWEYRTQLDRFQRFSGMSEAQIAAADAYAAPVIEAFADPTVPAAERKAAIEEILEPLVAELAWTSVVVVEESE